MDEVELRVAGLGEEDLVRVRDRRPRGRRSGGPPSLACDASRCPRAADRDRRARLAIRAPAGQRHEVDDDRARTRHDAQPAEPACLVIADISGYTSYLAGVELDHAQDILADLIGDRRHRAPADVPAGQARGRRGVRLRDPPRRSTASLLQDTIERCYFAFRRRLRDIGQASQLRVQRLHPHPEPRPQVRRPPRARSSASGSAGREELVGPRRDRRPPAAQEPRRRGRSGIARLRAVHGRPASRRWASTIRPRPACAEHRETYDGVGEVGGWVRDLERRLAEEQERASASSSSRGRGVRRRRILRPAPPAGRLGLRDDVAGSAAAVAAGVTDDRGVDAHGGRRGVGTDEPLHPRQGRGRRGDPRLAAVRLLHAADRRCRSRACPKIVKTVVLEPTRRRRDRPSSSGSRRLAIGQGAGDPRGAAADARRVRRRSGIATLQAARSRRSRGRSRRGRERPPSGARRSPVAVGRNVREPVAAGGGDVDSAGVRSSSCRRRAERRPSRTRRHRCATCS